MKVLIFGASGFIGLPVAQAFVRNGHEVYGQTRTAKKAKDLIKEEIIPVVADPGNGNSWAGVAETVDLGASHVSKGITLEQNLIKIPTVIECIGGGEIKTMSAYIFGVVEEAAKKSRGNAIPKMTYIYCSGTWVHGNDRVNSTSERSLPKNTTAIVSWRPALEQNIVASTTVDGIVIRPSILYGRSGSIMSLLFAKAQSGQELAWAARTGDRWMTIHADDLAQMFLLVGEAAPACKGLVFDAANDSSESVEGIVADLAHISGASGWKLVEPSNPFEEAITTNVKLRPSLARALVGWKPLKSSFADNLKVYYDAWKAFN